MEFKTQDYETLRTILNAKIMILLSILNWKLSGKAENCPN